MKLEDLTEEQLAELEKKAHAYDSDSGRLQKTQQELEDERAENARLKQLKIEAPGGIQIDARATEIFGEDGVQMLASMLQPVMGKLDEIGGRLAEREVADTTATQARQFQGKLDAKLASMNLPGFTSRLNSDLKSTWDEFVEARVSLKRALDEGDVESVADMVSVFITQNKEAVIGGYSPQPVNGGIPVVQSEYTEADYTRDTAALKRQRDNLAITQKECDDQCNKCYDRYVAAQQKVEKESIAFRLG